MKRKFFYIAGMLLLAFNGLGAIYGGTLLIADPSGKLIQMPMEVLNRTPFHDFLIPGIVLFNLIGVFSLVALTAMLRHYRYYPLLILCEGILLTGWILIEFLWTQYYDPLQLIMGSTGLLLMLCGYKLNKLKMYA